MLCVCFHATNHEASSLSKGEHGIFNMCNEFSMCHVHKGETGTDSSAQVFTLGELENFLPPCLDQESTHSCFHCVTSAARLLCIELCPFCPHNNLYLCAGWLATMIRLGLLHWLPYVPNIVCQMLVFDEPVYWKQSLLHSERMFADKLHFLHSNVHLFTAHA